jgi:hypothetical protein
MTWKPDAMLLALKMKEEAVQVVALNARKGKERAWGGVGREYGPAHTLFQPAETDFRLLASRTVRKQMWVLSHQVCGNL